MVSRSAQVEMLGAVDLFSGLSKKEVGLVLQYTRDYDYPAGKVVESAGALEQGGFASCTTCQRWRGCFCC